MNRQPVNHPIAIVGIGCRFPGGVAGPRAFFRLLCAQVDAITEAPARFDLTPFHDPRPGVPGKLISNRGGFIDDIAGFDGGFFNISPREAARMDPQQRLTLLASWEALEDAGIKPELLRGSRTGVFVGVCYDDYGNMLWDDPSVVDLYVVTGGARNGIPGRISYAFDLRGPSLAIDTACSSSLVAIHLALQSLRAQESNLALAVGVNLLLRPSASFGFSAASMLAPDGRCKAYDARANGFVRSEGVGVLVLKPLAAAQADGDPIYAVIRGSATNNDGRSSGFMMTPGDEGQSMVFADACRDAGIRPQELSYIEAHGTGTKAGDPVELRGLARVLCDPSPPPHRVRVGSVKTNIGHTEGAAGIAGVIKAALALRHGTVPASLHFETPNPAIPWRELPLEVQKEAGPFISADGPPLVGVSSFGIAGSNAHVILQACAARSQASAAHSAGLITLSAHTPSALTQLAQRTRDLLRDEAPPFSDLCFTTNVRRTHHEHRLALIASDTASLGAAIDGFLKDGASATAHSGTPRKLGRLGFVFPGQGNQWIGMGRTLLDEEPSFAIKMDEVDAALREVAGFSILEALRQDADQSRIGGNDMSIIQPAIFAIQVALAALWESWGVRPDAVIGHSMGEVAAAYVAGLLSINDAARIIARRSQLVRARARRGGMMVVELAEPALVQAVAELAPRVEIAAQNSATTWLLAGDPEILDTLLARFTAAEVFARRVQVDYASHCADMDPLLPELRRQLEGLRVQEGRLPFWSTLYDKPHTAVDAEYWCRNLRHRVRFHTTLTQLIASGHDTFIELSPHPVLLDTLRKTLQTNGGGVAIGSLRRAEPERAQLLSSLAALYVRGQAVNWAALHPDGGRCVPMPLYPWQLQPYHLEDVRRGRQRSVAPGGHPLLGTAYASSLTARHFDSQLGILELPWLADHRVDGSAILPATGYIEMALAAARSTLGEGPHALVDLRLSKALVLDESPCNVQTVVAPELGGESRVSVQVRDADGSFRLCATGRITPRGNALREPPELESCRARLRDGMDAAALYQALASRGLEYGAAFRGVSRLLRGDGEALGEVSLPDALAWDRQRYTIHPALLDACFQVCVAALPSDSRTVLPVEIGRVVLTSADIAWSHAAARAKGPNTFTTDVTLYDTKGRAVGFIEGLKLQALASARNGQGGFFHDVRWEPVAVADAALSGAWLLVANAGARSESLAHALAARIISSGGTVQVVSVDALDSALSAPPTDIVLLSPIDAGILDLDAAVRLTCSEPLNLLSRIVALDPAPRMVLVTSGAQGPKVTDPSQALAVGLGRVISQEHPALRCTRIDIEVDTDPGAGAEQLARALSVLEEDELTCLGPSCLAPRLRQVEPAALGGNLEQLRAQALPIGEDFYRMEVFAPGALDTLILRKSPAPPAPGPFEVAIEVGAVGLNFSDVLLALGVYPGMDRDSPVQLGRECAGTICAVGSGVTRLRTGQRVIAASPCRLAGFARRVVLAEGLVWPQPADLTAAESATLPIAWLTAWYGLVTLGRLAPGERVLIHYATGGVGLAALQIARSIGAEIFATAGSPEKREWLRAQGVQHVADSRSLAFADEVSAQSGGAGVDVVLNAIPGPGMQSGLSLLRPGGRFIELGKADVYGDDVLSLRALRRNISISVLDLDAYLDRNPNLVQKILEPVLDGFARGWFKPLPVQSYSATQTVLAIEHLARARHIGKVAVELGDPALKLAPPRPPRLTEAGGTWLITGGLGGLGLAVARFLADAGIRSIALIGRSPPRPSAQAEIAAMRDAGVHITVQHLDVSVRPELRGALRALDGPPLRGVVHAAGLLDDGVLLSLDRARLHRVLAPKLFGAWNLHEETRELDLDAFVLFSSAAALLGSPGQGNYAAGNAFMDALAHYRRRLGLPGVSLNWGPWAEVGLAARPDRGGRMAQRGLASFTPARGMAAFASILATDLAPAQVALMSFDAARWRSFHKGVRSMLRVEDAAPSTGASDLLAHASSEGRTASIAQIVGEQVARVTGMPISRLDATQPLNRLGVDSLMALELKNGIELRLGCVVPVVRILQGPSVNDLTQLIAEKLAPSRPPPLTADKAEQILASMDELPDGAVDSLLEQLLAHEEELS